MSPVDRSMQRLDGKTTTDTKLRGESFVFFIDALKSPATKRGYTAVMRLFCDYAKMDTENLVSQDKKDSEKLVTDYIRALKKRVDDKQISAGSIWTYYAAIKLFFTMNDIELQWKKLAKMLPEHSNNADDRAYTIEEVRTIFEQCKDVRDRIMLLLMESAGLRAGAIPLLKFKHITPCHIDNKLVAGKVIVYAGSRAQYTTFCSPECYRAIEKYKQHRDIHGEKVNSESPLLRQKEMISKVRAIGEHTIMSQVRRLLVDSGVRIPRTQKRYDVKASHGFRKTFNTMCVRAKVNHLHKELLMGHNIGLEHSYYKPTDDELLAEYMKAVPHLTINDFNVVRLENIELKKKLANEDRISRLEKKLEALATNYPAIRPLMEGPSDQFINELEKQAPNLIDER